VAPEEFAAGQEEPPDPDLDESNESPCVISARLDPEGVLYVHYINPLHLAANTLLLELWDYQGEAPLWSRRISGRREGTVEGEVKPELLAGHRGALIVTLTALVGGERRAGIPCWVIQEARLTREASGEGRDSLQRQIRESGQGLTRCVDDKLREGKIGELIEYLRHLCIKFDDESPQRFGGGGRRHAHDPSRPDEPPDWLDRFPGERRQDLWAAIEEFTDRHEKSCLRRHARRGNVNGMRNFLDVFVTLCGLLWHGYKLQLVPEPWQGTRLIERVREYVKLAIKYLAALRENLKGDPGRVSRFCDERNFAGHLRAALLIAQRARWEAPDMQGTRSPLDCLKTDMKDLQLGLAAVQAGNVSVGKTAVAFECYDLPDAERKQWH
jgi:hypothetical protein